MGKHEVKGSGSIRRSSGGSHAAPKHSVTDRRTDSYSSSKSVSRHSLQSDTQESWPWEEPDEGFRFESRQNTASEERRTHKTVKKPLSENNSEITALQREAVRAKESPRSASPAATPRRAETTPKEAPRRQARREEPRRSESRHASAHTAAPRRPETVASTGSEKAYVPIARETSHRGPSTKKRKSSQKRDPLITGVSIALVCVMLFAAFMLTSTILNYKKNRNTYSALNDVAVVRFTPKPAENLEEETEEVLEEEPVSEVPITINWEVLQQSNSEIVAWLYCPDTIISYPIVQAVDNDYYLTHDFYGNESTAGALFADMDSVVGLSASHLIVYGHNMKDNSMFGTLKGYADAEYYTEHPIFYLLTPTQNYRLELIQAQVIEATLDYYPTYFSTDSDKISYIDELSSTAYWLNTDNIHSDLQLITFSTCTSSDDERFIVQGTLIPVD